MPFLLNSSFNSNTSDGETKKSKPKSLSDPNTQKNSLIDNGEDLNNLFESLKLNDSKCDYSTNKSPQKSTLDFGTDLLIPRQDETRLIKSNYDELERSENTENQAQSQSKINDSGVENLEEYSNKSDLDDTSNTISQYT